MSLQFIVIDITMSFVIQNPSSDNKKCFAYVHYGINYNHMEEEYDILRFFIYIYITDKLSFY